MIQFHCHNVTITLFLPTGIGMGIKSAHMVVLDSDQNWRHISVELPVLESFHSVGGKFKTV